MREIKFREFKDGKMYPVFDMHWDREQDGSVCCMVGNREIMEYIGLSDRYGVDIYESDLLKMDGREDLYEVSYSYGQYLINKLGNTASYEKISDFPSSMFKVIGNIYEK